MRNLKTEKIVVAWILTLISVIPILFMVWLSILNADDINQSFFFPQNRNNAVVFFAPQKNGSEIAASYLGHIYEFSPSSNYKGERIADINSVATVYAQNNNSLWAFSANKGLIEIDLERKTPKNSYNWDFLKESYETLDHSRFFAYSDILPEHFSWLADNLNSSAALPDKFGDTTISTLAGIKFYRSEEIIGQLNWILTNNKVLNSILGYWKTWDGWLNPQIHNLFKIEKPTEKEKRLLFRFCLSELFPNKISRFKYFPWHDIWVSQVASSGLSVLSAGDKIIMGIRGGFFPGIAIFDTETNQLSWITETTGLPNSSIQNIIQISYYEVLVTHDIGFSIIQFDAGKVTHNFMFGEYELPYLDEQNLYLKTMSDSKILISYGTGSIIFDFRKLKTEPLKKHIAVSPLISYYYENEKGYKWLGYSDGKLAVLDNSNKTVRTSSIPKGKRTLQWSNYQDITMIMPLWSFIKNSLLISISISLLCTLLAIFPSYAIARLKFFGKNTFAKIVFSSQVLSSLPFLIPVFVIFVILQVKSLQMFNNFAIIILVNTVFFLPLTVQFMYNMFKAIPESLEESAMMDGCTLFKAFWKVIIPAIRPALATCLIYVFLFAWDEIMLIWILSTDSSTATLPVGIRMVVGQMVSRPELLMAFSVIASLPPMILFAFAHPFLLRSLIRR
ncbi:MAG: carbohydrate ABC transporter permease [Fibromonadales bacterium]|nr:carbohydrate ABC transporter permease [Fibromonadales bacterium]